MRQGEIETHPCSAQGILCRYCANVCGPKKTEAKEPVGWREVQKRHLKAGEKMVNNMTVDLLRPHSVSRAS